MKDWISLVGWHTADDLTTEVVTRQLQAERRTPVKDRPSTTASRNHPQLILGRCRAVL